MGEEKELKIKQLKEVVEKKEKIIADLLSKQKEELKNSIIEIED